MQQVASYITSLALPIFAFYLLVFCNFTAELLGCNLQTVLRDNIYAKHIIALVLLFFLIIVVNPSYADQNILKNIGITLLIYLWFIITTRSPFSIMMMILVCLIAAYIANIAKDRYTNEKKEDSANKAQLVQNILAIAAVLLSIIGFFIYMYEKKLEYKDDFSFKRFFTGTTTCKRYTPDNARMRNIVLGSNTKTPNVRQGNVRQANVRQPNVYNRNNNL